MLQSDKFQDAKLLKTRTSQNHFSVIFFQLL